LARALQIEASDEVSSQLKHGIEMIHRDMQKALADNHITKIDALGKSFDPVYHQAVKTVPAQKGQKSETVVEVYQDGYLLKDRVLRPAMVVVAQ
jgi:molecular chaperone GrpE